METIFLSDEQPLGSSDLKRLRRHAAKVLETLEQTIRDDCEDKSLPPPSWVGGGGKGSGAMDESNPEESFRKRYFDTHGFWVARGFCDVEEVSSMKDAMGASVRDNWFPQGTSTDENQQEEKVTSFGTGEAQNKARGDPFLESADKVSYFAEPTALDPESGSLKPEFRATDKRCWHCARPATASTCRLYFGMLRTKARNPTRRNPIPRTIRTKTSTGPSLTTLRPPN